MNIAFIVVKNLSFGGGIEKFTEEVGSCLVKKGHKVSVYIIKGAQTKKYSFRGMEIIPVFSIHLKVVEKMLASFLASLKVCLRREVQIVHYHAFGPAMFGIFPRLVGKKVIIQGHGIEWKRARWGWIIKLLLKITEMISIKCANIVSTDSVLQQTYVWNRYKRKSICIPNGVNNPKRHVPDLIKNIGLDEGKYILFVGRLVEEKGAHYLIKAFREVNTNLKLVITGDEKYKSKYKTLLHSLAKGNKNIIFTGHVKGKYLEELFSNCYLFVLPSELEGLSVALLEALSYGNCCLVSDIPENEEALGKFGYYFKNKDVGDLKEKIEFLLNNKNSVEMVKAGARSYVIEKYSWDAITKRLEDIYVEMLS